MGSDDSTARNPPGPADRNVTANIAQLRRARGLSYARLSARLSELGLPIAVLGLRRLEQGKRRVDAGDLVALALALGVNPSGLLLPRDVAAGDQPVALTPAVTYPASKAWGWADGVEKDHPSGDFLVHARPEYEVRAQVDNLSQLASTLDDPEIEDGRGAALARQWRDDLEKRASSALPGFTDEASAAEYAAWQQREQEREERDNAEAEAVLAKNEEATRRRTKRPQRGDPPPSPARRPNDRTT